MRCKETMNLMDDYLLGELTPEVEIQINDHLCECRTCKNELHKKEAEVELIRNSTVFKPGNDAFRRIKMNLPLGERPKDTILFFPRRFVYAFAAFVLGIVLMRSFDILFFEKRELPQAEIKYETRHQEPFVDTVEFYHAPAKNVAKI